MTEIKLEGAEELLAKLDAIQAQKVWRKSVPPHLRDLMAEVSEYPPKPEESKYRRTHQLEQRWYVKNKGADATAIGNPLPYASYVQGVDQRWYHKRTGWKVLDRELEKYLPKIVNALAHAVEQVWNR